MYGIDLYRVFFTDVEMPVQGPHEKIVCVCLFWAHYGGTLQLSILMLETCSCLQLSPRWILQEKYSNPHFLILIHSGMHRPS